MPPLARPAVGEGLVPALTPYEQLEQEFRRLHAFRGTLALLRWDAAVTMPRSSADVRGEQLAALETECHALLTSPRLSRLLERAEASVQGLRDWRLANLREMRRQRDHAIATPPSLVSRLARAVARAEALWREARDKNDFSVLAPQLEEVVKLTRSRAALLGQHLGLDPYDALADEFTPGLRSGEITRMFATLSRRLPTLVGEVLDLQVSRPVLMIDGRFTPARQRALCVEVMKALGFPFDRGRFDEAERAFTEGVPGDIRVAAKLDPRDPFVGLLGALHETGQALYDLGLPLEWRDQPVGQDRGMALEESQSLLLEMIIGRSRAFVTYLRPLLEKHYGASGPEWSEENLYRRLNLVTRGPIRMDADELTYQAHIIVRYELEQRLLSGELPVKDLPAAWNELLDRRLGVCPASDNDGCLQDIHWALGSFGYFPSYGIGAVVAAQFWEALHEDVPGVDQQIAAGEFSQVLGWLGSKVHALGARMEVPDLVKHATRRPLSATAYLRYLERKYLSEW
jgi:carboxypeptidase Taq